MRTPESTFLSADWVPIATISESKYPGSTLSVKRDDFVHQKNQTQLQRPWVDRFVPPRESFADERRRGSWRFSFHKETVDIWVSHLVFDGPLPCDAGDWLRIASPHQFVPPRESFADERRRGSWRFSFHKETVDIWEAKHQKQKNYKKYLDEVFGLESIRDAELRGAGTDVCLQAWPCAPRKKGYLSSADSILDLPTYSYAAYWSNHNMLVAALGVNYHMFSWKSQSVKGQGVTHFPIHCCKFNPSGDSLLVGLVFIFLLNYQIFSRHTSPYCCKCNPSGDSLIGSHMQTVELHDAILTKMVKVTTCRCYWESSKICAITAVDWSPTGNVFVSGCSLGLVISYDHRTATISSWKQLHRSPILTVKISPDSRYVAAVAMNSPLVHVLKWPSLEYCSSLNSNWIVKTIAWHPWRSALLGVGVMTSQLQTTIAMWDTPSSRLREVGLGLYNHYSLDVMLFSHRTGELVLSLWNSDRSVTFPKTCAQLVVMSDPYTVVDQSGEGRNGLDRVRTMVFSPDGTKLATATADEDLIIWNFLPEENKNKKTKPKRFHAMPVYLDLCTEGFVLR
ncbi:protein cortex [Phthorimaea operculella]|nr:protein cortex [Phthorimaea operculella]